MNENIYDLTPETLNALPSTSYTGKTMKNENDILMMNIIINDLGYTGVGDYSSKRKTFFTKTLPKVVEGFQKKTIDEIDLEGQGIENIIITSNIIDIYTRL